MSAREPVNIALPYITATFWQEEQFAGEEAPLGPGCDSLAANSLMLALVPLVSRWCVVFACIGGVPCADDQGSHQRSKEWHGMADAAGSVFEPRDSAGMYSCASTRGTLALVSGWYPGCGIPVWNNGMYSMYSARPAQAIGPLDTA
ncbi:hypothetical protein ACO22_02961 [Paracoccidioides brasiliensis]|uniref:Uncharacterized protein n=1 Tax=Paracoccidioides brasiliensis TaxID=121759 RepID=A0A1D2JHC3_PARBR|nr:hypothetical protein ACO22_02961 [Paracoccidioides brasiliensis]